MRARTAFIGLLTAAVVGTTAWLVFYSPVLGVRNVEIVGNLTVPADRIRQQAAIAALHPMATVDLAAVEHRILGIRQLATARASREWPATLKISVSERVPVAVVPVDGGKAALVDKHGVVIEIRAVAPPSLPVLQLGRMNPADPVMLAVLKVVSGLPEALAGKVKTVQAGSAEGISFGLNDGRTVVWGGSDRGEEKARVLVSLLSRKADVYDISSPDVVTLK
ncbi:cell division protein FtsQ/DivIB [Nonomuraea typhae]|uniref:cell division protein FtsQ/DivIB n=1 Tax=Nonomuraea typhae TaxID=2603600 RepID=UPI0012F9CCBE|nr:FtsQ-type POTRA domain-containing protein [Nonomuraea typhae]